MPWARVETDYLDHPKTHLLRTLLKHPQADVYPVRLWLWALLYAPSGLLSLFDVDTIARGIRGTRRTVEALIEAGFIDRSTMHIHDWEEHSGQYERMTASGRERVRRYRKRHGNGDVTVTPPLRNALKGSEVNRSEVKDPPIVPSAKKPRAEVGADFEAFWSAYPRKVGKGAAEKAWVKLNGKRPSTLEIVEAVTAQKAQDQWTKDNGQFIPYPSTWLNQQRWRDEVKVYDPGDF